jgi:hypothetical protein
MSETLETFTARVAEITARIAGRPVERALEAELERLFPAGGPAVAGIQAACQEAIAAGWMCNREGGGIRYGRVLKPTSATHGFSVDVVEMDEVIGPHHRHPHGEIDLVLPVRGPATFDGRPRGWVVYGPDSAHRPTVAGGKAIVLYLLPAGAIEFTPKPEM